MLRIFLTLLIIPLFLFGFTNQSLQGININSLTPVSTTNGNAAFK